MSSISRIDCHVHYHPREVGQGISRYLAQRGLGHIYDRPAWTELGPLTDVMDATDVDLGLIIPSSGVIEGLRSLGGPISENTFAYNRSMSEDLAGTDGRYLATAMVDPFGGKDDIAQLERALRLPHIAGIGLTTNYDDVTLDDERFTPIFEVAREFDVPVSVHPSGAWDGMRDALRMDTSFLRNGLGFFLVDSLCIFKMMQAGIFDRFPTVRFMFCQLGGVAPICCSRWDFHAQHEAAMPAIREGRQPLSTWARQSLREVLSHVWLETHTQDRYALQLVLNETGDHTIVLGGDYPFTLPDLGLEYTSAELDALSLPAEVRRKIECENALALLGPRAPKGANVS